VTDSAPSRRSSIRRYRDALRVVLAGESKAYGFTLVIWGTGAVTAATHAQPRATDVIAYVGGALFAIASVVAATYGGLDVEMRRPPLRQRAAGAIHLGSVGVAIAAAWFAAATVSRHWLAYGIAGTVASLTYQLVVGFEVFASTEE
jgi:hypothetical protein